MKSTRILLAVMAATATFAASAASFGTDDARDEASQRNTAAEHAAALRPATSSAAIYVSDSDSARAAASQANTQRAHDAYLAEVQGAGSSTVATVSVTDTDSARAAAQLASRQATLTADHQDYLRLHAQASVAR